jgi:hypothetical protein
MNTNDGGKAFPSDFEWPNGRFIEGGMSLRDWFAGMALPLLANDVLLKATDQAFPNDSTRVAIAKYAYAVADSMLAQRERKE